jgi:hypothetical protein
LTNSIECGNIKVYCELRNSVASSVQNRIGVLNKVPSKKQPKKPRKKKTVQDQEKKNPNYEVQIQEEPGIRNVQVFIQVNNELEENDFHILFSLIEEYNMIFSIKDIIEAKYEILKKMHLKEAYYPKQGLLGCVTIIEEFNKTYITYLKYYFKNKLIYFIGKQNKALQIKTKTFLEPIEFIISELVDNAFTYPFEQYLRNNEALAERLMNVPLLEKYDEVKKADSNYTFKATIFFEAKLTKDDKELIIGISNEADISEKTIDMINKRIEDSSLLPDIVEEAAFNNPYKETAGIGLSMVKAILDSLGGKIATHYDSESGRIVVEFSVGLDSGPTVSDASETEIEIPE